MQTFYNYCINKGDRPPWKVSDRLYQIWRTKMILSTDFNPIELESKIEQDYNASQGSYATGEWDALVGGDPNPDEWHSEEYRQGYLKGVESKYDSLYSVSSL